MSTMSVPFPDLAKRIQQQEADLAKLRQELESRSSQLAQLTKRKDELQAELAKIEAEIGAVTHATTPARQVLIGKTPSIPEATKSTTKANGGMSLPAYLVNLVRESKKPITAAELAETVVRNKFPTTSSNLADMVKTRVYDLVKKGVLKRLDDSGLVLASIATSAKPTTSKEAAGSPKNGKKTAKSASAATQASSVPWRSLHEVLTHVLSESSQPLTAQELADRVMESGYESKSKNFLNVIYGSLGKLPNVERVEGKGYRLKKRVR
jgi:uncharacterized protein YhaN